MHRCTFRWSPAGAAALSVCLGLAGAVLATCWSPAAAQELNEQELEQKGLAEGRGAGDWNVTLGLGVAAEPAYPGARAERAAPIPLAFISYRNLIFLGPFGLGVNLIHWTSADGRSGFRAGPVIGYRGGRDEDVDAHLAGLGNIEPSVTAGAFAAWRRGPFELAGTVRQAITRTSNGLFGLVQLDYRTALIPRQLDFLIGPDLEFANAEFDRTWFGVSPGQSAQSGLPVFTPGAGLVDAGLQASLTYHYSPHVLVRAFTDLKVLTGDDANSPIVQRKFQAVAGLGLAYHF